MRLQVLHHRAFDTEGHVAPAHAAIRSSVQLVVLPMRDIGEVHDSCIVVVLTRKDNSLEIPCLLSAVFRFLRHIYAGYTPPR